METATPSVFLAPCDSGNFEQTVHSSVDVSEYEAPPDPLAEEQSVRFWGVRAGSRNVQNFEKLAQNDLVLFYQDGAYVGTGRVGETFVDEDGWASETFWNDAPAKHVYTIDGFTPVSVPKLAVNRIFGYSEGYSPQGLLGVAERKLDRRPAVIERALEKYSNGR